MRIRKNAFSLIEILLVVVIMVSLSAMVVPRLTGRAERVKVSIAKTDINVNIPTALKLYELDNGIFPTTQQGLDALVKKTAFPPVPSNWNGSYIEGTAFIDPWGNKYIYKYPSTHGEDYDLYSLGKSGQDDDDNISNWE